MHLIWMKELNVILSPRLGSTHELTDEMWERILTTIHSNNLICTPGSGPFGFRLALDIWSPGTGPTYPGTEDSFRPEHLLSISARHLLGFDDDKFWKEVIEPLVWGRCKNVSAVIANGLGPLRERSYYEY